MTLIYKKFCELLPSYVHEIQAATWTFILAHFAELPRTTKTPEGFQLANSLFGFS